MQGNRDIYTNIAGLIFTTGLAFATQGSSVLTLGVLNGIAGNLASGFVKKTSYRKLKKLIQGVDPSNLNHDLQKLIAQAVKYAITNIEILYAKELESKDHKKELKLFIKDLIKEIEVLEHIIKDKEESIYQIIEKADNEAEAFKTFDLNVHEFPVINPEIPFNLFFEKQFKPNLELAFSELLKDEKNRPALIAYQRAVYKNLDGNINHIIQQNREILSKLEEKELRTIQTQVHQVNLDQPSEIFIKSINARQEEIYTDLKESTEKIQADIALIKSLVKGLGKDLHRGWMKKEKVLVFAGLGVTVVIALFVLYSFWSQPFVSNIAIAQDENIKVHPDYPKVGEEAIIRFYFPAETKEKELTFSNEIILNEIPKNLENQKIKAELIDRYWKLSQDSININSGSNTIKIKPNDRLSRISGRVLSRDGQTLLGDALVQTGDLQAQTNENGEFTIEVPYDQRRLKYDLRVERTGYNTGEFEYHAGSEKEIRLLKNK